MQTNTLRKTIKAFKVIVITLMGLFFVAGIMSGLLMHTDGYKNRTGTKMELCQEPKTVIGYVSSQQWGCWLTKPINQEEGATINITYDLNS